LDGLLKFLYYILFAILAIFFAYAVIRAIAYAIFKSYYQAKHENNITQKEESNGSKT